MFIQSVSSVANTPISFIRNRRRPRTASGLGQDPLFDRNRLARTRLSSSPV